MVFERTGGVLQLRCLHHRLAVTVQRRDVSHLVMQAGELCSRKQKIARAACKHGRLYAVNPNQVIQAPLIITQQVPVFKEEKTKMVSKMTITPEMAKHWLENNGINRKPRQSVVDQYARDMESGNWKSSDSAICFSKGGTLLNGQHRLMACVKSGCNFVSIVSDEHETEDIVGMDRGNPRSMVDNAKISMSENPRYALYSNHQITATARLIFVCGLQHSKTKASDTEVFETIDEHADAMFVLSEVVNHISRKGEFAKSLRNAYSCMAIVKAFESGVSHDMIMAFVDCVVFGFKTDKYADIITDNRLKIASKLRDAYLKLKGTYTKVKLEFFVHNAIYHFVNDDDIGLLRPCEVYHLKEKEDNDA